MNKKTLITVCSIIIIILSVLITILYVNRYENIENKSTLYNVEKINEQDSEEVLNFFLKCLNNTFNIVDINNKEILADSIRFQHENFKRLEYAELFENFYNKSTKKSLGIAKYTLIDVRKEQLKLFDDSDEESDCYIITYELSLSYGGDNEKKIGVAEEPCEAIISIEKDGFKLVRFFTKWVKL